MAKYGKRTTAAREQFADKRNVTVEEAVALVKNNAKAKFDETFEIAMNLGVDPRHADQMVRGVVSICQTAPAKLSVLLCLHAMRKLTKPQRLAQTSLVPRT